jgi:hypothetical protein
MLGSMILSGVCQSCLVGILILKGFTNWYFFRILSWFNVKGYLWRNLSFMWPCPVFLHYSWHFSLYTVSPTSSVAARPRSLHTNFMPKPLYPWEKSVCCLLNGMLGGPQSQSEHIHKEKILLYVLEFLTPCHLACCVVTVLIMLSQLPQKCS